MALRLVALTALSGAICVASCLVEGFVLLEQAGGSGGTSTSTGGAAGATGGGGNPCGHVQVPAPPASSDQGSDMELLVAMRELDLGESRLSDGPLVGFDLDALCTCAGEGASCNRPSWADAVVCDGPEGRDNAAAQLFQAASVFAPQLASSSFTAQIGSGRFSLLFRVRNYNGQPNDEQVTVAFFASPGRDKNTCMPQGQPNWDGSDSWPIASTSLEPPTGQGGAGGGGCGAPGYDFETPRFVDAEAYVSDGVLVAAPDELLFYFTTGNSIAEVHLTAPQLSARIAQGGSGFTLEEGVIAGRWPVEELRLSFVALANGGQRLCTDDAFYGNIRTAVCDHADIASELSGPTTPCDAVSFGIGFRAEPALLGPVWEPPMPMSTCPPGTDPVEDSCASRR
jgi:hypothetical protein